MGAEKISQTSGEAKISEYIARIQSGEPKDSVVNGLPKLFIDAIEKGIEQRSETLSEPEFTAPGKKIDDAELSRQKAARAEEDARMLTDIRRRLGIDEVSEQINYDQLTPEQVLLQLPLTVSPT